MGRMTTVLMGGERVSVVAGGAASAQAFHDVPFESDPTGLWVDPGVLVANGVMRVYIDREPAAYHARRSGRINYHKPAEQLIYL